MGEFAQKFLPRLRLRDEVQVALALSRHEERHNQFFFVVHRGSAPRAIELRSNGQPRAAVPTQYNIYGTQSPACFAGSALPSTFSTFSIFTLAMRWPSISSTVYRWPSYSKDSLRYGILCSRARTNPARVSKPASRGRSRPCWVSRSRMFTAPSSTRIDSSANAGSGGERSNSS